MAHPHSQHMDLYTKQSHQDHSSNMHHSPSTTSRRSSLPNFPHHHSSPSRPDHFHFLFQKQTTSSSISSNNRSSLSHPQRKIRPIPLHPKTFPRRSHNNPPSPHRPQHNHNPPLPFNIHSLRNLSHNTNQNSHRSTKYSHQSLGRHQNGIYDVTSDENENCD